MQVTFAPAHDTRKPSDVLTPSRSRTSERGQMLVIVALALTVLVAMAGLIIDGGMALANRRQVQNAAIRRPWPAPACLAST